MIQVIFQAFSHRNLRPTRPFKHGNLLYIDNLELEFTSMNLK